MPALTAVTSQTAVDVTEGWWRPWKHYNVTEGCAVTKTWRHLRKQRTFMKVDAVTLNIWHHLWYDGIKNVTSLPLTYIKYFFWCRHFLVSPIPSPVPTLLANTAVLATSFPCLFVNLSSFELQVEVFAQISLLISKADFHGSIGRLDFFTYHVPFHILDLATYCFLKCNFYPGSATVRTCSATPRQLQFPSGSTFWTLKSFTNFIYF